MKTQNIFPKEWIRFSPMVTMENRFAQNEELFRVQDLAVDELFRVQDVAVDELFRSLLPMFRILLSMKMAFAKKKLANAPTPSFLSIMSDGYRTT